MLCKEMNQRLPYMFGDEPDYLINLGKELPERANICMLGVGPGLMMLALYEGAGYDKFNFWGVDAYNLTAQDHITLLPFKVTPIFLSTITSKAVTLFEDDFFDLLIIDADHRYLAVKQDIANWTRKVKVNVGLTFIHDYIPQENDAPDNGVKQAVDELKGLLGEQVASPGCSVVFKKR